MRPLLRVTLLSAAAGLAGCTSNNPVYVPVTTIATPANFSYQLEPSGDPNQPAGILLFWDPVTDPNLAGYRIYSRGSTTSAYGLRGETSSITFHDNGDGTATISGTPAAGTAGAALQCGGPRHHDRLLRASQPAAGNSPATARRRVRTAARC